MLACFESSTRYNSPPPAPLPHLINQSLGCFVDVLGDRALENDDAIRACLVDERVMSPAVSYSCGLLG